MDYKAQNGRSRANNPHEAKKLTDLSSWSSILPRSKGQSAYYEIICTYKLGVWLKNDLHEVISIETGEKWIIPQTNC